MSDAFIPGYLGTITINLEDLSAVGSVWRLDFSKDLHVKPVFGSRAKRVLGGQLTASIGFDGHATPAAVAALQDAYLSTTPIPVSVQIGEGSTPTDAGLYTGNVVLGTLSLTANADGEVDFTASGQFDGSPTYTAPATGS